MWDSCMVRGVYEGHVGMLLSSIWGPYVKSSEPFTVLFVNIHAHCKGMPFRTYDVGILRYVVESELGWRRVISAFEVSCLKSA